MRHSYDFLGGVLFVRASEVGAVVICEGLAEHAVAALPTVFDGGIVADPRVVAVREVDCVPLVETGEAGAQGEAGDHVLVLPTPAVQARVVAVDGQEVGAAGEEEAGGLAGAGFGVFLVVDDAQLAAVGGADQKLVAKADDVAAASRVELGLAHAGQGGEVAGGLVELGGEAGDGGGIDHDVAVAEEEDRVRRMGGSEVLGAGLVEPALAFDADDADIRGVLAELFAEHGGRAVEVDDGDVASGLPGGGEEAG